MFKSRRKFLAYLGAAGIPVTLGTGSLFLGSMKLEAHQTKVATPRPETPPPTLITNTYKAPELDIHNWDWQIADNLAVAKKINRERPADLILHDHRIKTLKSTVSRLKRLQNHIGYGNFNIIGWDQSLKLAKRQSSIGAFEKAELDLIEEVFSSDADNMGFYGEKVVTQISSTIPRKEIKKIPGTGHYLFKGSPIKMYDKIRKDIGDDIVLTSGIRSVVKQVYLFLNKATQVGGNLSTASYSLAPPGHSFHAIGDFDVGKVNFGRRNFTAEFANTDEFKKLADLGYIDIRYPENNPFGVRYEPWHIKVV